MRTSNCRPVRDCSGGYAGGTTKSTSTASALARTTGSATTKGAVSCVLFAVIFTKLGRPSTSESVLEQHGISDSVAVSLAQSVSSLSMPQPTSAPQKERSANCPPHQCERTLHGVPANKSREERRRAVTARNIVFFHKDRPSAPGRSGTALLSLVFQGLTIAGPDHCNGPKHLISPPGRIPFRIAGEEHAPTLHQSYPRLLSQSAQDLEPLGRCDQTPQHWLTAYGSSRCCIRWHTARKPAPVCP